MTERVLTRRELNRALLARQLLLDRRPAPAPKVVERLGGLQAQHSSSPYLSLHARIHGFERSELTTALERRRVVRARLQRGTLHIVAPRDYWAFTAGRAALGRAQGQEQVVHVPPSGTWGYHGEGVYAAADAVLPGSLPDPTVAREHLVRSHLRAFGPATAYDVAQWAGLPRTGGITDTLASMPLRTFRDEQGNTLYDLPRAPLPDAQTPAPPRLVPRYDNLVLSHAERARVFGDVPISRIVTNNALVHATILVDGFVAGTWNLDKGRVRLDPFARLPRATLKALEDEAERIEAFVAD